MPQNNKTINIQNLLNHPETQRLIGDINHELLERRNYNPPKCKVFADLYTILKETDEYTFDIDKEAEKKLPKIIANKVQIISGIKNPSQQVKENYCKKRNIGVVFSGGPAPGGHNVIAGIFDAAKLANPDSKIYGFWLGPDGIIENTNLELTKELVDQYRNLGGFTMIKTGRTKIDNSEKVEFSRETCKSLNLDALVIIGGDDSNTNAAFLAQEMFDDKIQVIGVPKTIDGDIQVKSKNGTVLCAMSFGFHSAARAFAKNISDLCTDCSSDIKYWHICKVMGRVASHLAQEVALQTHPNITLIGEDLADYEDEQRIAKAKQDGNIDYTAYGMTLRHLSRIICKGIVKRSALGKNYGVIVIPEGVLEFINEIQVFIIKLNTIIAEYNNTHDKPFHISFPLLEDKLDYLRRLARRSREDNTFSIWNTRDDDLFNDIPPFFQEGLMTERDSHGNFQFSLVETDKIIMGLVKDYLNILKEEGKYKVGINKSWYHKTIEKQGLDPDLFGRVLFRNYDENPDFYLVKESIMSLKTLKQVLVHDNCINGDDKIPSAIEKIYKKSVAQFKTQLHFYGYDGRGSDPTIFDCNYTYNLGLTAFSLIANGATGQMAAIKNLELDFDKWQPIGIPIAPLMHLEERKGKMTLVIEKSVVDLNSPTFQIVKAMRKKWLAATPGDDSYRRPGPIKFSGPGKEDKPITLALNSMIEKME